MKRLIICIAILCAIMACISYILITDHNKYEAAQIVYQDEKIKWDIAQAKHVDSIKTALYNEWITNNDTTIRAVKQIQKNPKYDEYGHYEKTGRLKCKSSYNDELICEPEKRWVTTYYALVGYTKDTIWTNDNKTREDWLNRLNRYIKWEMRDVKPKEFYEYDSQEYNGYRHLDAGLYVIGITVIIIAFAALLCLCFDLIKEIMKDRKYKRMQQKADAIRLEKIKDRLWNLGVDEDTLTKLDTLNKAKDKLYEITKIRAEYYDGF